MPRPLHHLTPEDVAGLSYVEFISLLRETNRCPGGKDTVRRVIQNTFLDSASRVLEIGSNTGFTSLELARTARCRVVGVDPVEEAVEEARRELSCDHPDVRERVRFEVGSAYELRFPDDEFDVVVAGGATSFMGEKERALKEYHRVLKPWGFLSVTNLFYRSPPPPQVVDEVSRTIGVRIESWSDRDWLELFGKTRLFEVYLLERRALAPQSPDRLDAYVDEFMTKEHLGALAPAAKEAVRRRWRTMLEVFNENHKYLGYLLTIFRKRYLPEEPELFLADPWT